MTYTEVLPLCGESPRKLGGLSYTSGDVGVVLAISGLRFIVVQSSLYPLARKSWVLFFFLEYLSYFSFSFDKLSLHSHAIQGQTFCSIEFCISFEERTIYHHHHRVVHLAE